MEDSPVGMYDNIYRCFLCKKDFRLTSLTKNPREQIVGYCGHIIVLQPELSKPVKELDLDNTNVSRLKRRWW